MYYKETTRFAEKISPTTWAKLEKSAQARGFESLEEFFGAEFYPHLKTKDATAKVRAGLYYESKDSTEVLDKVAMYVLNSPFGSMEIEK